MVIEPILDYLLHRIANVAGGLASPIVTQHVTTAHAVPNLTVLVLAGGNVLPQDLHLSAVGSDGALAVFGGAL